MRDIDPALARYSRQIIFPLIGLDGQKRLKHSSVTLIGCGALGTVLANTLVRAGVGHLRIVDRDFIEMDNLQRQVLFDEHDISQNLPKAEAAARKLHKTNSAVEIEGVVADANPGNIESFCENADLLLDGTDNFETRFLLNDVAVKSRTPWVYGACIGAEGMLMPVLPHDGPCLRCIWEEPPPPGTTPTCDTAGVIASAAGIVASWQALEAMKLLMGKTDDVNRNLTTLDVWTGRVRSLDMREAWTSGNCVCCKQAKYEFLAGNRSAAGVALCGRNAVQVSPAAAASGERAQLDFRNIADRLPSHYRATHNAFMLKFNVDDYQFTVFKDGRAIIKGTNDTTVARSLYAKHVGA
jgi:molybdopterin-synthase adenylyltransferase